jgi:predicted nucleotidyltransferase
MDKREAFNKARKYAELVKETLPYKKAILFGSYAYGKPSEYSDIDTGFYIEELGIDKNYLDVLSELYKQAIKIDVRIEPHLFIRSEDKLMFWDLIEKKGKILF